MPNYGTLSIIHCAEITPFVGATATATRARVNRWKCCLGLGLFPLERHNLNQHLRQCFLSNVRLLNGHNTCKMEASSIPFSVGLRSGSPGCCWRLWCLTSSRRTVRNKTQVMMMRPDFFLWCTGDVLGIAAPMGLFLRHVSFKTLRQSSHAPFSPLGRHCSVFMNIKVQLKATGYDDVELSVKWLLSRRNPHALIIICLREDQCLRYYFVDSV